MFRAGVGVGLTKSAFVGNITEAYRKDPVAFKKEIRAAIKDGMSMFDTNLDCLIEKEEFLHGFQDIGRNNVVAEMEYFKVIHSSFKSEITIRKECLRIRNPFISIYP